MPCTEYELSNSSKAYVRASVGAFRGFKTLEQMKTYYFLLQQTLEAMSLLAGQYCVEGPCLFSALISLRNTLKRADFGEPENLLSKPLSGNEIKVFLLCEGLLNCESSGINWTRSVGRRE